MLRYISKTYRVQTLGKEQCFEKGSRMWAVFYKIYKRLIVVTKEIAWK